MNDTKILKILLVEDDVVAQAATNLMLINRLRCEISIADSGEEGLEMAADNMYDLILMDIGLPEMNGIEVTRRLKQSGLNSQTPIVAITAHTDEHTKKRCIDAGMNGFLYKPFSYLEIKTVLEQLRLI